MIEEKAVPSTTIYDPETGHPIGIILPNSELLAVAPSRVGETIEIGQLHLVLARPGERRIPVTTVWDGAAPDRHGGFTKGEMLGEYQVTGELYATLRRGGPGFKVQSSGWAKRAKAMQRRQELETWFEDRIAAASEG